MEDVKEVQMKTAAVSGKNQSVQPGEMQEESYMQITPQEAKKMMEKYPEAVILDVRTPEEFETGHVPGAICIPNESIVNKEPEQLPDKTQIILVYCRSGNRSRQAAGKLAKLGYESIYEFGGIFDWPYEVE